LENLYSLSATKISNLLSSKKISLSDYLNSITRRISSIEKNVLAWQYYDEDFFLSKGRDLENFFNPYKTNKNLAGIPIGIKDVFNSADMPTEMGSPIWRGFTPGNNARVLDDIIYAGGIIMGKTVTAEFAVHHPGKTLNPHNARHMPGTSSSGSAAAVASGMTPIALGTQTAGSTTRPSSYCGVYGYKPSFGLVPRTGILKTLDTLDHVTIFSREINDTRLMLDTIRVKGRNHPYIFKNIDNVNQNNAISFPLKIAFVKTHVWKNLQSYMKEEILSFANKLSNLDSLIVNDVSLPSLINETHINHDLVYSKALSYYFSDEYENHYDDLSESFKEMVEYGRTISIEKYQNALIHQNKVHSAMDKFFDDYDIILSMSTAGEAPLLNEKEVDDAALIWTYAHTPSINIPIAFGPNNLPLSIQLVAKKYNDYKLLNFVEALQNLKIIPQIKVV
jgi:Asp-tRNA(Asn)/Glu-tRNA(Gln) amidotransferase A subunit family amidase